MAVRAALTGLRTTVGADGARLRAATAPSRRPRQGRRAFVQIANSTTPRCTCFSVGRRRPGRRRLQKTTEEGQQWAQLGRSVDFDAGEAQRRDDRRVPQTRRRQLVRNRFWPAADRQGIWLRREEVPTWRV